MGYRNVVCVCVQIKPLLAIWRVERETKEKQAEIDKLMTKVANLESERDALQESENRLSEKVCVLCADMCSGVSLSLSLSLSLPPSSLPLPLPLPLSPSLSPPLSLPLSLFLSLSPSLRFSSCQSRWRQHRRLLVKQKSCWRQSRLRRGHWKTN